MPQSRGKDFEKVVKEAFEAVQDTAVIRLYDSTTGYLGQKTPCDFIVFHSPFMYAVECKSVHGDRLPFSNITDNQKSSLLELSKKRDVIAGVLCWWVDRDVTKFIEIQTINNMEVYSDKKSIRYDYMNEGIYPIGGKKKRVFFDYDMNTLFRQVEDRLWLD